jgi:AbrB family looped-hinge helix DNA binding protein
MPALRLSVIQEKGQVTIPTDIRKRLGLKKGDRVSFIETEQGILISPQEVVAINALAKIGAILKENGLTLEDMIERGRESRAKIIAKKYPRLAKRNRSK